MHQLALLHDAPVASTTDISQVLQDEIIDPDELPRNPIVTGSMLHNSTACYGVNYQLLANSCIMLHVGAMSFACQPDSPLEHLWHVVKKEALKLSQRALRLMGTSVNCASWENLFFEMGLTHTKVRNRP